MLATSAAHAGLRARLFSQPSVAATAERKLKLGDVLCLLARLLANEETRAAALLVEEMASSDVAESELKHTAFLFNRQLIEFASMYSDELSATAFSDIRRHGSEDCSTTPEMEAGTQVAKNDEATDSARSASGTGGSMRESVVRLCRRVRHLSRRATTGTGSVSELKNPGTQEGRPRERKSSCREYSSGESRIHACCRYSLTDLMIGASNRELQVRRQAYSGAKPSETKRRCHAACRQAYDGVTPSESSSRSHGVRSSSCDVVTPSLPRWVQTDFRCGDAKCK